MQRIGYLSSYACTFLRWKDVADPLWASLGFHSAFCGAMPPPAAGAMLLLPFGGSGGTGPSSLDAIVVVEFERAAPRRCARALETAIPGLTTKHRNPSFLLVIIVLVARD